MLEYPGELEVVEVVVLDGRLPKHLIDLLLSEPVSHGRQQFPQVVLVDLARVVVVEALERVPDHLLRVGAVELLAEHGQEHGEVDGAWRLSHHAWEIVGM